MEGHENQQQMEIDSPEFPQRTDDIQMASDHNSEPSSSKTLTRHKRSKNSVPIRYRNLNQEQVRQKRARYNTMERLRQKQKQRLFTILDQLIPEEFKTSDFQRGSNIATLENTLKLVQAINTHTGENPSRQLPQGVTNNVSLLPDCSSQSNQNIPQSQQNQSRISDEELQKLALNISKFCPPSLPSQPSVLGVNQHAVHQTIQPSLVGPVINQGFMQPMVRPPPALLPMIILPGGYQIQRNMTPPTGAPLNITVPKDTMPIKPQNVPTQFSTPSQSTTEQDHYSVPATSCSTQPAFPNHNQSLTNQQQTDCHPFSSIPQDNPTSNTSHTQAPIHNSTATNLAITPTPTPTCLSPLRPSVPNESPAQNLPECTDNDRLSSVDNDETRGRRSHLEKWLDDAVKFTFDSQGLPKRNSGKISRKTSEESSSARTAELERTFIERDYSTLHTPPPLEELFGF